MVIPGAEIIARVVWARGIRARVRGPTEQEGAWRGANERATKGFPRQERFEWKGRMDGFLRLARAAAEVGRGCVCVRSAARRGRASGLPGRKGERGG